MKKDRLARPNIGMQKDRLVRPTIIMQKDRLARPTRHATRQVSMPY